MAKGKLLRNTLQPFTSQLRARVWVSLPHNNNNNNEISLVLGDRPSCHAGLQLCTNLQYPWIYHLLVFQETLSSPASLWVSQQVPHSHLNPPQ